MPICEPHPEKGVFTEKERKVGPRRMVKEGRSRRQHLPATRRGSAIADATADARCTEPHNPADGTSIASEALPPEALPNTRYYAPPLPRERMMPGDENQAPVGYRSLAEILPTGQGQRSRESAPCSITGRNRGRRARRWNRCRIRCRWRGQTAEPRTRP